MFCWYIGWYIELMKCSKHLRASYLSTPPAGTIHPFNGLQAPLTPSQRKPEIQEIQWFHNLVSSNLFKHNLRQLGTTVGTTMPQKAKELSARAVAALKTKPGRSDSCYAVGGVADLYLNVKQSGSRSWLYRYLVHRKRHSPIGLGSYPGISLSKARELAKGYAGLVSQGIDPRTELRRLASEAGAEANQHVTFREFAETHFIPKKQTEYKGADQVRRLQQLLRDYVYPHIGSLRINEIDKKHIVSILDQRSDNSTFWQDKHDAAKRTQNYIENIFNQAIAIDVRTTTNPAVWRGLLSEVLPSPRKVHQVTHRPAIHHKQLAQFVKVLIGLDSPKGSRPDVHCFLFGVLTIARSNEARLVDWDEINLRKKIWLMPAGKYKSEKAWVIPLTREAIKILRAQPSAKYQEGRVFSTLDGGKIGGKNYRACQKPWDSTLCLMASGALSAPGAKRKNLTMKQQNLP